MVLCLRFPFPNSDSFFILETQYFKRSDDDDDNKALSTMAEDSSRSAANFKEMNV